MKVIGTRNEQGHTVRIAQLNHAELRALAIVSEMVKHKGTEWHNISMDVDHRLANGNIEIDLKPVESIAYAIANVIHAANGTLDANKRLVAALEGLPIADDERPPEKTTDSAENDVVVDVAPVVDPEQLAQAVVDTVANLSG